MQLTEKRIREIVREEIKAFLEEKAAAETTAFYPSVQFNATIQEVSRAASSMYRSKRDTDYLICK